MASVIELVVDAELEPLEEAAARRGWPFKRLPPDFLLSLPARDQSWFHLRVKCDRYAALPPSWHWANVTGTRLDHPADTPVGGSFLHSAGVICAPWNRLAYKEVDARGPHGDWAIGDWRRNPYTKGCTTLLAMALRIYVELTSAEFKGRLEATA